MHGLLYEVKVADDWNRRRAWRKVFAAGIRELESNNNIEKEEQKS